MLQFGFVVVQCGHHFITGRGDAGRGRDTDRNDRARGWWLRLCDGARARGVPSTEREEGQDTVDGCDSLRGCALPSIASNRIRSTSTRIANRAI